MAFSLFLLTMVLTFGFSVDSLYQIKIVSFYPYFAENFYHGWVLNFVKWLFGIHLYDNIVFSFLSFMVLCVVLIGLQILYQHCIPWINPTWSKYLILSIHWWVGFVKILLKIFVSTFFWGMVFTVFLSHNVFISSYY